MGLPDFVLWYANRWHRLRRWWCGARGHEFSRRQMDAHLVLRAFGIPDRYRNVSGLSEFVARLPRPMVVDNLWYDECSRCGLKKNVGGQP